MKLFVKYNRINVISTIIIFLLGSLAFGFLLHYIIIQQIDEDLKIEENEIITYVKKYDQLPAIIQSRDQLTTFKIIKTPGLSAKTIYTDKTYNENKHAKEPRRIVAFNVYANGNWYLVNVNKSLEGTDNLIQTITIITLSVILLVLAVTFFINRFVLRRLWQPFYNTLQTIEHFSLNNNEKLNLNNTTIDEFSYLNTTLSDALNKAQQDYQALKEFTENASHELQTPLAVIQSKLDILIQSEKLSENESQAIQSAYNALQNLSKLDQSLLLLTKIENKQFSEQSDIDVKALLQNKIDQFNELWKIRNIVAQTDLSNKTITGNTHLVDILLNNLLSNATKHNITNGSVTITLNGELQVINTGVNHSLNVKQLYKRFAGQNKTKDNLGLGLSIIQQICITSGYNCTYSFIPPNIHSFTIRW